VVHASEFLLAKRTSPATLAVGLRQSHVARDATTGTKRWRRELWCFFFNAGASEAKWAHALSQPMEKRRVFLSALNDQVMAINMLNS
jgi:hypothetical protein